MSKRSRRSMRITRPIREGDLVRLNLGPVGVPSEPGIVVEVVTERIEPLPAEYKIAVVQWPNENQQRLHISQLENLSGRISIAE